MSTYIICTQYFVYYTKKQCEIFRRRNFFLYSHNEEALKKEKKNPIKFTIRGDEEEEKLRI